MQSRYRSKIKFQQGFIVLNRQFDREIFKDSKLFSLLVYVALRVARKKTKLTYDLKICHLDSGQFVIGRLKTVQETDLSEEEYRNRIQKLEDLEIIQKVKATNQGTIYKWIENSFIDLNLPPANQPSNNQQDNQDSTTNNNNLVSFISSSLFINDYYSPEQYIHVLKGYMHYKGIKLEGEEAKDALWVIQRIFLSHHKPVKVIECMKWFKSVEENRDYVWAKNWNIGTVQKKLPEFLAGKLEPKDPLSDYEEIIVNEKDRG